MRIVIKILILYLILIQSFSKVLGQTMPRACGVLLNDMTEKYMISPGLRGSLITDFIASSLAVTNLHLLAMRHLQNTLLIKWRTRCEKDLQVQIT
jgi:hypothetical protein